MMKKAIETWERDRLRELAKRQLSYARSEVNQERIRQWYRHNDLQGDRPMIQLEMATFEQEIIPDRLKCTSPAARALEAQLYRNFLNLELFDDDRVVPDFYPMGYDTWFKLFDIDVHVENAEMDGHQSLGHHFIPAIEDLEEAYESGLIKPSSFGVDLERTEQRRQFVEETIGDILPVQMKMDCLYSVPTQMIVHIMSMEQMMFNMYDYPELFKKMMNQIADDTLAYYRMLE